MVTKNDVNDIIRTLQTSCAIAVKYMTKYEGYRYMTYNGSKMRNAPDESQTAEAAWSKIKKEVVERGEVLPLSRIATIVEETVAYEMAKCFKDGE